MNRLVAVSSLVFGFGVGAWSGYHVGSAESADAVAHPYTAALVKREAGLSAGRADLDPDLLRALIREEMSAALAARGANELLNKADAPVPAKDTVTPEKLAQGREAQEQIDAMLSQGVWGNEQRLSLQQKLVVLDPEHRERALQQIITAINNGTLQVSTDGPPL